MVGTHSLMSFASGHPQDFEDFLALRWRVRAAAALGGKHQQLGVLAHDGGEFLPGRAWLNVGEIAAGQFSAAEGGGAGFVHGVVCGVLFAGVIFSCKVTKKRANCQEKNQLLLSGKSPVLSVRKDYSFCEKGLFFL